jgi:hypothetical protein
VGYYVRVLGIRDNPVSVDDLRSAVIGEGLDAEFEIDSGTGDAWSQLIIKAPGGGPIAVLERNLVVPGELAEEEIQEFIEEMENARPHSAARWLAAYLPRVKVIYAFQILSSIHQGDGWSILGAVRSALWSVCGGVVQADAEGFSNEDGYHILWQFSEDVSGPWFMAVLNADGSWSAFQMELGDPAHREAFLAGRMPEGAERA